MSSKPADMDPKLTVEQLSESSTMLPRCVRQ